MLHPATYLIRGLNSLCSCSRFCRWTHPPLQQRDREGPQYDLCWVVDQKWDGEEGEVGLTSKDNLHHWDACGSKQGAGWMDGWGYGGLCVCVCEWMGGVHVVCAHHMQVYTKSEGLVC